MPESLDWGDSGHGYATNYHKTKTIKGVLPGYEGIITQDSYPAWLHIGSARQMCVVHQERLVQKDLEWNPGGDVTEFLAGLSAVHKKIYRAWRVKDPYSRAVAADCIDSELAGLFAAPYQDDRHGTIAKYRKRRYREGYYSEKRKFVPSSTHQTGNYVDHIVF